MLENNKNNRLENFTVLLNLIADPVCLIDEKGIILAVNQTISQILGFSEQELVGKNALDIGCFDQENKASLIKNFEKRMKGLDLAPYEVEATTKNGEIKLFEVKGKKIRYNNKIVDLVLLHDVTEQKKKTEERINLSEEKYRNLFENAPDVIVTFDLSGKITSVNKAIVQHGFKENEIVGSDIFELVPRVYYQKMLAGLKNLAAGNAAQGEIEILTPNGKRSAEYNSNPIWLNGKVVGYQTIIRDTTERKHMNLKLGEAEQRYHALFDQAPLGVLVINPETAKPVEFNDAAHTQLGYSREEFSKLRIPDFEAKETTDEVNTHLARMLTDGGGEFETKHRTKNGEIRDVLVTTRSVELRGKTLLHCIFHDITEIRKVQDALMKSESQYRQLVNVAQEGIWALDDQYRTVYVNSRIAEMLGYVESEMVGRSFFDFIDPKIVEIAKRDLEQRQHGTVEQFEYEFPRKDGTHVYTSISSSRIKDDEGNSIGTLALVADITDRKKAETSLRSSEEKFRNLSEQSPNIIFINQKGKVVYANAKAEEATGYKKEEFYSPKFDFMTLIAQESKELVKSKFIKHMKGEEVRPYEYKLITKKGQTRDAINSTKVIDFNGEQAILGIETDITENKRLKEKLEQYSMHLESLVKKRTVQLEQTQAQLVKSERLAAIGELAGMVVHDLRNPLTGIKNAAYFLKKKGNSCTEAQSKEMLEIIDKAIDHANKIVSDLLDYSREMHLELTEVETSALLNEAVRMIQVPDRVQIVNHVLGETWFRVDADKMMRVFINLIKNAIDAMPEKGTLEIRSRQMGGQVEIAFADTGVGISDEVLPKIFSPLFTTKATGMGFGLAICKRVIESHRGTITVKTTLNKGTTFTITLPIKPKLDGGEKTWISMPESLLSTTMKA